MKVYGLKNKLVSFKLGRIPLHYVNSTSQPQQIWDLLVAAGSPTDIKDDAGKTPRNFLDENAEVHLPGKILYSVHRDGTYSKFSKFTDDPFQSHKKTWSSNSNFEPFSILMANWSHF